jgi:hypothetical protein
MRNIGGVNLRFLAGFVAVLASPLVLAWDGLPTGIPGQLDVAQGSGGLGFRVALSPAVPMCGNANTWAYLNTTDTNYSTNVAIVMMAKAQGLRLTVYTTADSSGYCHIGYIVQL